MKLKVYFKEYCRFLFVLIFPFFLCNNTLNAQQTLIDVNGWNAYVHLPWDYSSNPTKTYQTIIFFPGTGEVGTDASKVIANGPGAYIEQGWNGNVKAGSDSVKFIIISLQPPSVWPQESTINSCIQTLKGIYRIDNARLHLTGLSMGGWCSNTFVTGDPAGGPYTYASQVATVVEVEGVKPDDNAPYPNLFDNFANNNGRLLGFEQINDSRDIQTRVDRMNSTKANSAIFISTNYGGGGHCCWEQFYGGKGVEPNTFTLDGINQNIYQWMAVNPSTSGGSNQPPVSYAGSDIAKTLPENNATLNGSGSDADGTILSYAWTKTSGPSPGTIASPNSASTNITNLAQGVYQFTLTVTDNKGSSANDVVQITVNAANNAPVANAGSDVTVDLPANSVSLNGSGSDADGTVSSYAWAKTSGPSSGTIVSPANAQTDVSNLTEGTYVFSLTVTDNSGNTATDNVQVVVNAAAANTAPVANSGPDVVIIIPTNSVTLYGSGTDADGTIASYQWAQISGPNSSTIENESSAQSTMSALIEGVYVFQLTVTDNKGATSSNKMQLSVKPSQSEFVGPYKHINVNVYGEANPFNNSAWNNWNVGAGANSNITSGSLKYSDGSSSGVNCILSYSENAGENENYRENGMAPLEVLKSTSFSQQARTLTISGLSSSLQYNIDLYSSRWSSGNSSIFTVNGTSITIDAYRNFTNKASFTNLTPNAQGSIIVEIASAINYNYLNGFMIAEQLNDAARPLNITKSESNDLDMAANAGKDVTIKLPANAVTLKGTGLNKKGQISNYLWMKASGPSSGNILSPGLNTTRITDLSEGVYKFVLRVTDKNGAAGKDTVQVTVNSANKAPVAFAGNDTTISLSIKTYTLTGSGTDADGKIVSYRWRKISGNKTDITKRKSAKTAVRRLKKGNYKFELTVTDNAGLTDKDTIQISLAAGTKELVADAGGDAIVTLPTKSYTLNGSGAGSEGKIISYKWRKISGRKVKLVKNNLSKIKVSRLAKGTYKFELTITDDNGLQGKDTMQLIVRSKVSTEAKADQNELVNKSVSKPEVAKKPAPVSKGFDIELLRLYKNQLTFNVRSSKQQTLNLRIIDVKGRVFLTSVVPIQNGYTTITKFVPGLNNGVFYVRLFTDKEQVVKPVLHER